MLSSILANSIYGLVTLMIGWAFSAVLSGSPDQLAHVVLLMIGTIVLGGCADIGARIFPELIGKRVVRDARQELYLSLLSKSQTFHNRPRHDVAYALAIMESQPGDDADLHWLD